MLRHTIRTKSAERCLPAAMRFSVQIYLSSAPKGLDIVRELVSPSLIKVNLKEEVLVEALAEVVCNLGH
jgi:hypothetical protein